MRCLYNERYISCGCHGAHVSMAASEKSLGVTVGETESREMIERLAALSPALMALSWGNPRTRLDSIAPTKL